MVNAHDYGKVNHEINPACSVSTRGTSKTGSNVGKKNENAMADDESESDVEAKNNETAKFMASHSGSGIGKTSLYER